MPCPAYSLITELSLQHPFPPSLSRMCTSAAIIANVQAASGLHFRPIPAFAGCTMLHWCCTALCCVTLCGIIGTALKEPGLSQSSACPVVVLCLQPPVCCLITPPPFVFHGWQLRYSFPNWQQMPFQGMIRAFVLTYTATAHGKTALT